MGLAAASFWRKDFILSDLLTVGPLLAVGGAGSFAQPAGVMIVALLGLAIWVYQNSERSLTGIWKNKLMVAVVSAFAFACQTLSPGFGDFAAAATVAVAFQLLRRPAWLKNALRTIRVATGPLYAASSIAAFLHAGCRGTSFSVCIASVGVVLVGLAAVVMRPDNIHLEAALAGALGLRLSTTSLPKRAMVHGLLMLASAALLAVLLAAEGCVWTLAALLALLAMELSRHCPRQRAVSGCVTPKVSEPPRDQEEPAKPMCALHRTRSAPIPEAPAMFPAHPAGNLASRSARANEVQSFRRDEVFLAAIGWLG